MKMKTALWIVVIVVLVVLGLVFIPAIGFWSVRALFGFGIPYTGKTWLAFWALVSIVRGGSASRGK